MISKDLKNKIVGTCTTCEGSGVYEGSICSCTIKFRAYLWLTDQGFIQNTLDLVSSENYKIPQLVEGTEAINYYSTNFTEVMKKGLSLYLYSPERGWGKTTLAHYLVYQIATYFLRTENYSRDYSYGFENISDMLKAQKDFNDPEIWKSTIYVLDDLGNEDRSAKWKKDTVLTSLQQILHYRRDNRLPTILTSNYAPQDLSRLYDGILDSLLEIGPDGTIGGSLIRSIEVGGGEDYRLLSEFSQWPEGL